MQINFKSLSITLALVLLISNCKPLLTIPSELDEKRALKVWPDYKEGELKSGHSMYINSCGSCHSLKLPTQYKPEKWPKYVASMAKRAKINENQTIIITRYLQTMADTTR
jgi:hypothetical protein